MSGKHTGPVILMSCLISGKLFWNRKLKEFGPALLAAVSIPGALKAGDSDWPVHSSLLCCFGFRHNSDSSFHFPYRYYAIYDSGDRQGLLDAYHDGACCSLSIPPNSVR